MLPLTDPLWQKLDSAVDDKDVPMLLFELAESWDRDKATLLLSEVFNDRDVGPARVAPAFPR